MLNFFKQLKINNITNTHSEKISDYDILCRIVNPVAAKNNLTTNEFAVFKRVYNDISKRTQVKSTYLKQYEHRAFNMVYEFDGINNIPYQKICGGAKDVLNMYIAKKPFFDEMVVAYINEFDRIINDFIIRNHFKVIDAKRAYLFYIINTIDQIIKSNIDSLNYDSLSFLYSYSKIQYTYIVYNEYKSIVSSEGIPVVELDKYLIGNKETLNILKVAYANSNSLHDFVDFYTLLFIKYLNATDDSVFITDLKNITSSLTSGWNK